MIKVPLFLNFLVECSIGVLMFFSPQFFHVQPSPEIVALSRAFAIGAFVLGLLTLKLALSQDTPQIRLGLWLVLAYHSGIAIVQVLHPMPDMNPLVAPIFHGSLALWSLFSLVILRRWY